MAEVRNTFIERYYLDRDNIVVIDGQKYFSIRLKEDVGAHYQKDQVCAYISTNLSGQVQCLNSSFFPDLHNKTKIPIIKGQKDSRLKIVDSYFEGDVVIDLDGQTSLSFENMNVHGDVRFGATFVGTTVLKGSHISGENISIVDTDISCYYIQGQNISMRQYSLIGDTTHDNTFEGKDISFYADDADIGVIEKSDINGDNITIKGASNIVGVNILSGTLVDSSDLVCEHGTFSLTNATIIENSKIRAFGDISQIDNTSIKDCDITIGKHQNEIRTKEKEKIFELYLSSLSGCKNDMPKIVKNSVLQDCDNIYQYRNVNRCEMIGEEYQEPLLSGIYERFGFKKESAYSEDVSEKYITATIYEDLDRYHKAMEAEKAAKEKLGENKDLDDDLVF